MCTVHWGNTLTALAPLWAIGAQYCQPPPLYFLPGAPNSAQGSLQQVLSRTVLLRETTRHKTVRSSQNAAQELLTRETSVTVMLLLVPDSQDSKPRAPDPGSHRRARWWSETS